MSAAMDSCYPIAQSDYHRTPALEAIAAAGMRFSSAYSASPVCHQVDTVSNLANHPLVWAEPGCL